MTTCLIPPPGWACTRPSGHDGPCAAVAIDSLGQLSTPPPPAVTPVVAAKVLSVLRLDEYSTTDDEHDLIEVLVHDASRTVPLFTDDVLLEWAHACRLACETAAGLQQLRDLAAEADR